MMSPEDWEANLSGLSVPESECSDTGKHGQVTICIDAEFQFSWSPEGRCNIWFSAKRQAKLILPSDLLLDESWGRLMVTEILSATGVPVPELRFKAESLLEDARSVVGSTERKSSGSTILPMSVFILCYLNDAEEVEAALKSGSIRDKYSLKGLSKVDVEGEGERCSICLEDIPSGSVAACLPCSHVYHHNCVIPWLVMSETCPLCRFRSPDIAGYPPCDQSHYIW